MAIFADLDQGDEIPCLNEQPGRDDWRRFHGVYNMAAHEYPMAQRLKQLRSDMEDDGRVNPNLGPVTAAFGCYPVIIEIASHLDLNSLDNLSRTCRQARSNLLQFRKQLINSTLHCINEEQELEPGNALRFRARVADWYFVEPDGGRAVGSGKVGDCARDLVGDCRRCGSTVCRNCTIKPPAPILLAKRHRRLCPTCVKAPIQQLLASPEFVSTKSFRTATPPPPSSVQSPLPNSLPDPKILLQTTPYCTCPTTTYLCQPCGRSLRSADTTYDSIWRWRTRYNASGSGGMGTGISDGNRSFECGRSSACLRAKWVEEEIDCDAEDAREIFTGVRDANTSMSNAHMAPGYMRHEIEGIGGVVKKKMLKMVRVGACVTEWEDEKERGMYLVREAEGRCRSSCGWCHRIVLGEKDLAILGTKE